MTSLPPEIERKFDKINELQKFIMQADALEETGRVHEALAGYDFCLQMAARERIPFIDGQLPQIWMGKGFCYSNYNDWSQALEWYHLAEEVLLSAPGFDSGASPEELQAKARRWSSRLPDGTGVVFRQGYSPEPHLAELYDSIALAYDNDNQVERAQEYYRRSLDLHSKLKNPGREAAVRFHQAIGHQRRQQWFDLEQTAGKMLLAAESAQSRHLMLSARRLLAQSQINQNRPFKTVEHLSDAVLLARELKDARLATDEQFLGDLVHRIRSDVLQRRQAEYLEPLLYAEAVLNDPNLAQDKALFQKWESEQPAALLPGSMPLGALDSLSVVAMVLEHFALRHCGNSTQAEERPKKVWAGIFGRAAETVNRRIWEITEEEMQIFQKDAQDQIMPSKVPCAILTLFGQPEVIVAASLMPLNCNVTVLEKRALPGAPQAGYVPIAKERVSPQADVLLDCLNGFILRGLFVKTEKGLRYVGSNH